MFYKADFCGKLRSTTSSLINRQAFCGFWSSLCFKPVLAQSARCKVFVTKGRQLSLGLPQNEPCSIWYRLGKSEFFYLFAWGIANFLRLEVGVLKIFLIKNNFTCPPPSAIHYECSLSDNIKLCIFIHAINSSVEFTSFKYFDYRLDSSQLLNALIAMSNSCF